MARARIEHRYKRPRDSRILKCRSCTVEPSRLLVWGLVGSARTSLCKRLPFQPTPCSSLRRLSLSLPLPPLSLSPSLVSPRPLSLSSVRRAQCATSSSAVPCPFLLPPGRASPRRLCTLSFPPPPSLSFPFPPPSLLFPFLLLSAHLVHASSLLRVPSFFSGGARLTCSLPFLPSCCLPPSFPTSPFPHSLSPFFFSSLTHTSSPASPETLPRPPSLPLAPRPTPRDEEREDGERPGVGRNADARRAQDAKGGKPKASCPREETREEKRRPARQPDVSTRSTSPRDSLSLWTLPSSGLPSPSGPCPPRGSLLPGRLSRSRLLPSPDSLQPPVPHRARPARRT